MSQPAQWTPHDVAKRFEQAVMTLRRLPPVRVQGYISAWPPILRDVAEQLAEARAPFRLGPPAAEAITRMEQTLCWIYWLADEDERRLVWLRAARVPWRPICWQIGYGRTKAWQVWKAAMEHIAAQLNRQAKGDLHAAAKKH